MNLAFKKHNPKFEKIYQVKKARNRKNSSVMHYHCRDRGVGGGGAGGEHMPPNIFKIIKN